MLFLLSYLKLTFERTRKFEIVEASEFVNWAASKKCGVLPPIVVMSALP